MRRFQALLVAAGLAAAPASAVAKPSGAGDPWSAMRVETLEWSASKGPLGVLVMSLTPELQKHLGAGDERGVLVARVEPGTPAAKAGIAVGDVIVSVRGQKVSAAADVLSALSGLGKDQAVTVELVRDGKARSLEATLDADVPRLEGPLPSATRWFREWFKPLEMKMGPPKPHALRT